MPYVIMGFVVLLGLGGMKLYSNGDSSGYDRGVKEGLEIDKQELIDLNLENADLVNKLNLQTAEHRAKSIGIEDKYETKLKSNREAHDLALDQYGNTIRVLLNEAQSGREDQAGRKREVVTSFINGFEGTEGSKLTPETRRDLELLSIDADKTALLLGLCQDVAESDRE